MPKVGMQPIRHKQLIDATVAAIHAHGFADATVKQISARAGVSSGIIHHYFGSKDALLEATMRSILRDLRAELNRRLAEGDDPLSRLQAVIDASFAIEQFAGAVQSTWLCFWAQTRHSPALGRLGRLYLRRLRSNLRYALNQLMPADEAARVADGLAALIDGLWLTAAVVAAEDPEARRADRQRARDHAADYLAVQLARAGVKNPAVGDDARQAV